ncbi:MAG: hypothetical protein JNK78_02605 [Planctomycetes bacterium]|nr:hypothetical protein [Planctomycetota bacterium]
MTTRGSSAHIVVSTTDPLETSSVRILADRDGDMATTGDQCELGIVSARATTTPIDLSATIPMDLAFGSYTIFGTIADGVRPSVQAKARGRLLVDVSHSLSLLEPATDVVVSRGGQLRVSYIATDNDGVADLRFLADADGDRASTGDQFLLANFSTSLETQQTQYLDLSNLPLGTYHVFGIASDAGHQDVVVEAGGTVQVTNVAFAVQEGGTDYEEARALAVCPDGSIVATGRYAGSSLFGSLPSFISLNSAGDDDLFLARYSATGALLWAKSAGGPSRGDWGNSVASFPDGSILLGGYFHGLAAFNGGSIASGLLSAGEDDAFVARYSANGSLLWVQRAGGVFHDEVGGVATTPDGGFFATGHFRAQATFGDGTTPPSLIVAGSLLSADGFVARYAGDGSIAWVRQFGGADGDDQGVSVAAGADGSCFVTGTFTGSATFGQGANQVVLTSAGGTDVFVARYDAAGTLLWARRGGGPADDVARGITLLPNGAAVACGAYTGAATFGPVNPASLQAAGLRDAFVARFDADGTLAWARSAGGTNDDEARAIAATADGGFLVSGAFHTLATFGQPPSQRSIAAVGLRDAFVARYDASGTLSWVKRAGGANHDGANTIAAFPDGSCAFAGQFQDNGTFGGGSATVTLTATGLGDVFVARINADGDF